MAERREEAQSETKGSGKKYSYLRPIIGIAIVSLLLGGIFFPFLITGIAQVSMPYQANGEIIQLNGRNIGSNWINNNFTLPIFFHARPSNASASGVDPDITIPMAMSQIPTISNATGIPSSVLVGIVNGNAEGTFWVFGSPYVNVLQLNLALIHDYPTIYANFTSS